MIAKQMIAKQPLIVAGIQLPIELTPAEAARFKVYLHIAAMALFNAALAALAILGKGVSWADIGYTAVGQGFLALMDALYTYYSASGKIPQATVIQLVRNEEAAKLPAAPKLDANLAGIQSTVNQMLQPGMYQNQSAPAVVNVQPVRSNPPPVIAPPVIDHPSLANVELSNTLPNIAAVSPQ